jgi:hypothetical protein
MRFLSEGAPFLPPSGGGSRAFIVGRTTSNARRCLYQNRVRNLSQVQKVGKNKAFRYGERQRPSSGRMVGCFKHDDERGNGASERIRTADIQDHNLAL